MAKEGKTRKKDFHEGREGRLATVIITSLFVFLLALAIILSTSLVEAENLRLDNAVERAYSDVLMVLRIGGDIDRLMDDKHVLGFGYYTHTGTPMYIWGDAYQRLPITSFPNGTGFDGSYSFYDNATHIIETVRYVSSISIIPENIFRSDASLVEYPDIIYISFDASSFAIRVRYLVTVSILCCLAIVVLCFIVLRIFRQNTLYRETLRRQENLVRLGEAARTLTHEIKNPLSAIRLEIAILKRALPENLKEDVRILDQETERLRKLTDKVSDYLRNPLGKPHPVDIIEEIRTLIPLFPKDVRYDLSAGSIIVLFDPERLRSVLENLVKNAVEACEGRDIDVDVEAMRDEKGGCYVFVRDRGKGLGESDEKRIFDPFYTTKIHGSGIGLSISQQFVRAAGGTLRLYPRDGGGAIAEVYLKCHGSRKGK